jgi:hypothetical protein
MKDFRVQSAVLFKEVNFDELEAVAVFELKLQEKDLSIEELIYVYKELIILAKDPVADIHDEDEPIRHLIKDVLKRSINRIEEILSEPEDRSCRVERCSNIARNVQNACRSDLLVQ